MKPLPILLSAGLFALGISGCGQSASEVAEKADEEAMLNELLSSDQDPAEPIEGEGVSVTGRSDRTSARDGGTNRAAGERLELRLRKGERFPLIKTVEQTLVQKSATTPALATTRLELALAITVEDIREDAILLGVRYSRVAYEHDVNGQRLKFDSGSHEGSVPFDAIPYAGMIGNGFAFWLGRDNSIRELVGYQEFLEACVRDIPLERRQGMLAEISNRFGDDGVANFIDDSIGLLPFDSSVDPDSATRVMPGDVWTRERRLMQPVPIYMTSTYRLTGMTAATAEIDITGRIKAGEAVNGSDNARLKITGGHSLGRCVVDRATGLPLDVSLTRNITMTVVTADQQQVVQEKAIVTSIRAFPEARGSVVDHNRPQSPARRDAAVRPAADVFDPRARATQIPTQPSPGSNVQAVYPD